MYKLLSFVCGSVIFGTVCAQAFMPDYPDDDEYYMCVKATNDYDSCSRDQMHRNLNTVKKEYRTIITDPNIIGWHKELSENTATLRDMYESWTAFRTRLCSLSNKAAVYTEPILDEKTSCNSYYVSHHKDHLNSIILLLDGKVPQNRADFTYLEIYDHDDEYSACMKGKDTSKCLEDELKRSSKQIKNLYKTFSEDKYVGKWNNGPDLKNGNYRDMYDSWVAYRNRMCSLSLWAYAKAYGKNAVSLTQCLQFFNREKLETMQNLLVTAHSFLDEEYADELGKNDDGGAAEGQTIKPLKRRFDSDNGTDALDYEEKVEPLIEKKQSAQPVKKDISLPSWAKQ